MFWNGKKLGSHLGINGQLYPNLFATVLSDLHSYRTYGRLCKTNCYSTFFDLISGKGNEPAVFRNFAARIIKAISNISNDHGIYETMKKINFELQDMIKNLNSQISGAELHQGCVRAEFRLKLSDYVSVSNQLNNVFTVENLADWTVCLDTQLVCKLASFHVNCLKKLLNCTMTNFIKELASPRVNNYFLMKRISAVSLLESLLCTTLFTGLPYNFASELVWRKSVPANDLSPEIRSLELANSIRSKNRIVFDSSFFDNEDFAITADETLLTCILGKITRNKLFQFPPIRQILDFMNPSNSKEYKAELLFEIYFSELNKNAFLPDSGPRWKLVALNRDVITSLLNPYSFRSIVTKVFDFQSFKLHNQWRNKYYMNQANKWVEERGGISKDLLYCLLIEAIRKMGIEHVHYPGTNSFNFNPAIHVQVDLSDRTPREESESLMEAVTPPVTSLKALNTKEFRDSELVSLICGVNQYGEGKWKNILDNNRYPFVFKRTSKSLSDKWARLKSSHAVHYDPGLRQWFMPGLQLRMPRTFSPAISEVNVLPLLPLPPLAATNLFDPQSNDPITVLDDVSEEEEIIGVQEQQPDTLFEGNF